ncbi:Nucleic acid-binding, OB-fold [Sesbania bispinosa]|nr:Nucleic acid-binding, OB-fold [Sesbania bispinosa]
MAGGYDHVANIFPGRQNWRLRVRVVRLWNMFPIDEPSRTFSIEMVLVDEMGERIQASIRKPMIKKFGCSVIEGEAYKMHFFGIVRNLGSYRATKHEYKLIFHAKTKISRCEASSLPLHGICPMNSEDIMRTNGQSDYLVDVVGVLTAISAEKRSFRDGRMTRVMQMELTDDKGKVQCAMFGSYVDMVGDLLTGMGPELPVMVVMFAKVKLYKGIVVLQNVLNTTKILCNPNIAEVEEFRNLCDNSRVARHDIDILAPLGVIVDDYQGTPPKDEFLHAHPRKSIKQLHETEEVNRTFPWGNYFYI